MESKFEWKQDDFGAVTSYQWQSAFLVTEPLQGPKTIQRRRCWSGAFRFPHRYKVESTDLFEDADPEEQLGNIRATTIPEGEVSISKFKVGNTFYHEPCTSFVKYWNLKKASFARIGEKKQIMEAVEGRAKKELTFKNFYFLNVLVYFLDSAKKNS